MNNNLIKMILLVIFQYLYPLLKQPFYLNIYMNSVLIHPRFILIFHVFFIPSVLFFHLTLINRIFISAKFTEINQ